MLEFLREKLDQALFQQVKEALTGETLPPLMEEGALSPAEAEKLRAQSQEALTGAARGFALRLAFEKAGALDGKYLQDAFLEKAEFDEEGGLINGGVLLEQARKRHPALFSAPRVEGIKPAESFRSAGPDLADMSYAERARLFAEDPEAYRRMRM